MWVNLNVQALVKRLLFATTLAFSVSYSVLVLPATTLTSAETQKSDSHSITADELLKGLSQNLSRVDEFRFLQEQANKLGVKVYLFGGTAAAFAHYVKWDLLRIKGDTRFHPARFDYRYINIYRSTQDLDIVVDGPITAIKEIQKALQQQFPYLQGSKTGKDAWEVRSLHENLGDKLALLNNPDFLQQHTDSNSVGLIEVTDLVSPLERVRDLRDWENRTNPGFLRDIIEGKIHYYFSQTHNNTKFYLEGRNPPILSAVRYFIKVLQLDLEMRTEDLTILQKIINEFEPESIGGSSYLQKWFQENGPKLIQNAIDVERAMKLLEHVGLRQKLLQIGNTRDFGSLAWWMNKQPLESFPLLASKENPDQQTAADLKLNIIAHETTSFQVFEAITRSHQLLPNVLISRENHAGETAAYGEGFYAMVGDRSGFRGTGFTIRFTLDPRAILNRDFTLHGNYIVIKNRNAIRVIPENLKMDLIEYYNWLGSTETLSKDDLGIYERLRLAMRARFINPTPEELKFLAELPLDQINKLLIKDRNIESRMLLIQVTLPEIQTAQEFLNYLKLLESQKFWQSKPSFRSPPELHVFAKTLQERGIQLIEAFLAKRPKLGEFQAALEMGLFQNHSAQFLRSVEPYLGSPEDILSLLKKWKTKIPKAEQSLGLTKALALLGRKFFKFGPSVSQTKEYNELTSHPILSLSLGAKNPADIELFIASLEAASLDPNSHDAALKVWQLRKQSFWAANPDKTELIEFISRVRLPAIQAELIDRLVQFPRLRREEILRVLSSIGNQSTIDASAADQLIRDVQRLTENFFALKPTITEIGQFLSSESLTTQQRVSILNSSHIPVQSAVDIRSLGENLVDKEAFKAFFLVHQDRIKQLRIAKDEAEDLVRILNYSDAAVVILEAYSIHHPDDLHGLIELLSHNYKLKQKGTDLRLEALWIKGLEYAKSVEPNRKLLWQLKTFAPTADSLALLLIERFRESKNLETVLNSIREDTRDLFHGPNKKDRREFGMILAEILPKMLQEKLPQLLNESVEVSKNQLHKSLDLAADASTHLRILDLYLTYGFNEEGSYPWVYTPPISEDRFDYRPKMTKKDVTAINNELMLYTITHRAKIAASKTRFSGHDYAQVLSKFFTYPTLKDLGLLTEEDFLIDILKFYLLVGIKNTVFNETRMISMQGQETEIYHLLLTPFSLTTERLPFHKKLQMVADEIRNEFGNYPWLSLTSMTKKKDHEALVQTLQQQIDLTDSRINQYLLLHPALTQRVNALLNPTVNACKQALTY